MKRNFLRLAVIFGLVLVLGLALVGCDQSAEIFVENRSNVVETDLSVRVQVWGAGGGATPLREEIVPFGFTVPFSLNAGDYRVRVTPIGLDGRPLDRHFWFPHDERALFMSGVFRLRFDGHTLTRTN